MIHVEEARQALTCWLEDKYRIDLESMRLIDEINGMDGRVLRAICRCSQIKAPIALLCYETPMHGGEAIRISGVSYYVCDDAAQTLFQEHYADELKAAVPGVHFAAAKILIPDRSITKAEYAQGLDACLRAADGKCYCTAFLVAEEASIPELTAWIRGTMTRLPFAHQRFLIAQQGAVSLAGLEESYRNDYDWFELTFTERFPFAEVFCLPEQTEAAD